jgi:hypothetical protein
MLALDKANELFRRSYPRSLVVFFYGLVWLMALLAGYLLIGPLFGSGSNLISALVVATWTAALAGAIGGTTAMLSRLYQHVSISQDFPGQSLLSYFVQPLVGLAVGILSFYLVVIPGAIIITFITDLNSFLSNLSFSTLLPGLSTLIANSVAHLSEVTVTSPFVALQILLAWIAGFRQQVGLARLKARLISPAGETISLPAGTDFDENEPLFFKLSAQQRRLMVQWSFTWGIFLLVYGIIWLMGLVAGYLWAGQSLLASNHTTVTLILAAWPSAAAGGIGGVFSLLNDLYQHISIKQDFHRQHLISYLVQPIIGFIFGLIMYLFIATGYLSLKSFGPEDAPPLVDSPTILTTQLALGWIAGFRQQTIADIILRLVEGVVSLLKAIVAFFNPAVLFDQIKREQQAAKIKEARGMTDLFELLDETRSAATTNQKQ